MPFSYSDLVFIPYSSVTPTMTFIFCALFLLLSCRVIASQDFLLSYNALKTVDRRDIVHTILRPNIHPETDTSDVQHLRPQEKVKFFYSTDNPENSVGATLDLKLNFSTVPLEHSDAIQSVQCTDSDIRISLNSREAFDYIAQTWPSNGSEFILAS